MASLAVLLFTTVAMAAPPERADRFLMYQLSYTDRERAIALLTTLGYHVIAPGARPSADQEARYKQTKRPLIFDLADSVAPGFVDVSSTTAGKAALTVADLKEVTSAVPNQRLLIRWHETEPKKLQDLLDLLRQQIDVAARQLLVEAMVLELDTGQLSQLGFAHSAAKDGNVADFLENFTDGTALPFTYQFTRPSAKTFLEFSTVLKALVDDNKGKVLSRPSVLVLDGHQARIVIGDKLPYSRLVSAKQEIVENGERRSLEIGRGNIISQSEYLDVNLTLNIRPRANEDGSQVAMQVEALISTAEGAGTTTASGAVIGPPLVTRAVETNVRVANDTPFVIGGLIRSSDDVQRGGVPYLSRVPLLGKLFRRTNRNASSTEVIIIIIPHVIPLDDQAFGFTIAKDSELFDRFDSSLFRNVYRVRTEDVFDLDFIRESDFMRALDRWVEQRARAIYEAVSGIQKGEAQERALLVEAEGTEGDSPEIIYPPVSPDDSLGLAQQLRKLSGEPPSFLNRVAKEMAGPGADEDASLSPQSLLRLIRMLEGATPGEDKLVKRMLLEVIDKQRFGRVGSKRLIDFVVPDHIHFFPQSSGSGPLLELEKLSPHVAGLERGSCSTLELSYERGTVGDLPFDPPVASVKVHPTRADTDESLLLLLRTRNVLARGGSRWDKSGVLIDKCYPSSGGRSLWEHLKTVLVLKRLIDLNPGLPLTLDGFHVGLDLVIPTQEDLELRQHIVDRETAALFYETLDYYYAFERTIRCVLKTPELSGFVPVGGPPAPAHPDCGEGAG